MIAYQKIGQIIKEDLGGRQFPFSAHKDHLFQVAQSLANAKKVMIVTGFYIEKFQTGETDGPLGAIFLAHALEEIGIEVTLLTSPFNQNIIEAAMNELNLKANLISVDKGEEYRVFPSLIADDDLTHLIAVEQMGVALDGNYYNMAGDKITHPIAHFDALFLLAREKGIITIAIGDGGNEVGMGTLYPILVHKIEKSWILNITPVTYLIPAGVSNWGAYGIIASLSILLGNSYLHLPQDEKRLLKVILSAGAVDGRTYLREMSVDGIPVKQHMNIVQKLHRVITQYLHVTYYAN